MLAVPRMVLVVLIGLVHTCAVAVEADQGTNPTSAADALELGRSMYMDGILPSGEMMRATISGDIAVSGDQFICGTCHRRSGMGSSEGQEVVPAITGDTLYNPLRLPASKPPLTPLLRPAYTDATLKRAIREGIDANGKRLSDFMPRYALTDQQLVMLLGYLKTLTTDAAPGVTERDIHFATITTDAVPAAKRKALLDVLQTFFEQKNTETRHETQRFENAPWHKDPVFKRYRKWVLHVWDLHGAGDTWDAQLEAYYKRQPVFAVLSGVAVGSWKPVHEFCERSRVPCLFPTTDLPVDNEQDFYSVYFSRGMTLEGEAVVQHLSDDNVLAKPVVQVYRQGDPWGDTAAAALRRSLQHRGGRVTDLPLDPAQSLDMFWDSVRAAGSGTVLVLWLGQRDLAGFWRSLDAGGLPERIYLSTTLYGGNPGAVPGAARQNLYFVVPHALPDKLPGLLARSTGWLRVKRIYSPAEKQVQANAYFALKIAGGALTNIHTYFSREYFLESIEHMVDNAVYTSVYPRISLAPDQRFVAKGCYITRLSADGTGRLEAVTDWLIPGSR